jgi:hypothetical protein
MSFYRLIGITALLVSFASAPALAQDDWGDDGWDEGPLPVEVHGFAEAATGARVVNDATQPGDFVLNEARFRLDLSHVGDRAELRFKGDFVSDDVTHGVDTDVREALMVIRASNWLDIRAGRQVLTWGTGDLVFLNDLFPKDYQSFFIGREDEFLKAPSNSIKFSAYSKAVNVDVVWTPVFESDRYITGERLSFFNPMAGGIVSATTLGQPLVAVAPADKLENGEVAGRLYRNVHGYELALYGYKGYTKQPRAFDPVAMMPTFSELAVYGASVRGNLLGGIANVEGAYQHSLDDEDGTDPNVPNSQVRTLVGYERELFANFTAGVQHYLEWIQNYDELIDNSPNPDVEPREDRQMVTTRLTYRAMQETLTLSMFAFVALQDGDFYLRPVATRKWTDAVAVSLGGNVMAGDEDTFFGQLEDNTNVYLRFRYSF